MGPPPPSRPLSFLLPFPCHLRAIGELTTQTARIRGLAKPALGRHRVDPRRGPQSETRLPTVTGRLPRCPHGRPGEAGPPAVDGAGRSAEGGPAAGGCGGRGLATGHVLLLRQTAARWPGARRTPPELSPQARWQTDT